ncbi:GPI-anchored cell wall organization protein-domain-containing protein [Aspergillus pseudoustus]|uniref:GPI-anchored cell wall organization protein-domain-containing protein n=1 Tax=Aspergillus pseudoustus TaxID=1810923 RepID=A0ABR4KKJ4_9EURO
MAFIKYALPVLAAANAVFAADCGSGDTIEISSQSDLDSYNTCEDLDGDVEIASTVSGTLTLNGVQRIRGALTSNGAENITTFSAPLLETIDDEFHLEGLTGLTSLEFAQLKSVGSLNFEALPVLQTLGFTSGVTKAGSVSIVNTGLTTLDGISLNSVGSFIITDNTQLETVDVNNLKNATNLINFAGNYHELEISLPNLATGTNLTIRNVSSVSIPSLTKLEGQLGFWGNTFSTLSAPNLTETGDLVFEDNERLSNLSLPVLETVNGGFLITRNDELNTISFPKLATVTGAIDFSGAFDRASLPSLKNVRGGFNMQSTGNFSCDTFNSWKDNTIHGTYECKASTSNPTTSDGTSGSSTNTTSSDSSDSTEDAAVLTAANVPVMGAAAIFGMLVQYVL